MQPTGSVYDFSLKALFFVHLVFPTWSLQYNWAPSSYFFYNLIFLVVLVWTMHQTESVQAVIVAFYLDLVCLLFDVVHISLFLPWRSGSTTRRVSSAMAIVNLFVRPISAFLLYKVWKERKSQHQNGIATIGGDVATFSQQKKGFGTIFSSGSNSPPRKSYQEIPSVAA